jgi:hypothetical protein
MTAQTRSESQVLYDQDYALWLEATVEQLRQGKFSLVDWENLLLELEGMNRSDRRSLESLLTRLLEHLLKLAYWQSERDYNERGWKGEIRTFRIQIRRLLQESPSLKPYLAKVFDECYQDARSVIIDTTGLPSDTFPQEAFASLDQVLDWDWLPHITHQNAQ